MKRIKLHILKDYLLKPLHIANIYANIDRKRQKQIEIWTFPKQPYLQRFLLYCKPEVVGCSCPEDTGSV